MSEEKLFLLMEHAEQLQDRLAVSIREIDSAAKRLQGPLIEEASKGISAAVAKETGEQLRALREALEASQKGVREGRLNIWLALIGATVLALLVVTWGSWQAFRATEAERVELAEIRAEIADAEKSAQRLADKTWGVRLREDKGIRWIELQKGWEFGRSAKAGNRDAMFIMKK